MAITKRFFEFYNSGETKTEMQPYHKIQNVFKRDMENGGKSLIEGLYTLPEFGYLVDNDWIFTEKVDGTNIRVMWDGEKVTFGGRTERAHIPADLLNRLRERFDNPELFAEFESGVCLYGEGYGAKIQKVGSRYRDDQDFILFDVRIGSWWLQRTDVENVADKFGVPVVPIVRECSLREGVDLIRSGGFDSLIANEQLPAEGVIGRPRMELTARNGSRIITKIKTCDFSNN